MDSAAFQISVAQKRVQQMMATSPQKLEELIICHISRRLDLDGDKLDLLINGKSKPGRKASLMRITSPFQRRNSKQEIEKENQPDCEMNLQTLNAISKLILSLHNARDLRDVGLFRKCGQIGRQKDLKQQILEDCNLSLAPYTTHDRASVIKLLLADIPEPLLLARHFEAMRQAVAFEDNGIESAEVRCLRVVQLIMLRLPENNLTVAKRLISLLSDVADETTNKMDATALGTVFAPHFLCSKEVQSDPVLFSCASRIAEKAVTFMIKHSDRIFQIPAELDRDVTHYVRLEKQVSVESDVEHKLEQKTPERELSPVNTSLTFVPRSSNCQHQDTTEVELAKLHAHLELLPVTEKRKIKKQLTDTSALTKICTASTPSSSQETARKHFRSKSIGSSIRKRLPNFGIKNKRQSSCDSDPTSDVTLVRMNIDFEDISTNNAAIIDCRQDLASKLTTDSPASAYSTRRDGNRRRRRHSEGEATPPKVECLEEAPSSNLFSATPAKDGSFDGSPLPYVENERTYIPASHASKKLNVWCRQSPVLTLSNKIDHGFSQNPRPSQRYSLNVLHSPVSVETSL